MTRMMLNLTLTDSHDAEPDPHDAYEEILSAIRIWKTSTTANMLTTEICV